MVCALLPGAILWSAETGRSLELFVRRSPDGVHYAAIRGTGGLGRGRGKCMGVGIKGLN